MGTSLSLYAAGMFVYNTGMGGILVVPPAYNMLLALMR